jgi:hypothetical protein
MQNKLEQSIIATLSYFDIFEYPLTLFEIRKNLVDLDGDLLNENCADERCPTPHGVSDTSRFSLVEIENALGGEELKNRVEQKNGFYFLKNRSYYLTRQKRYYFANKKFKRAMKIAFLLSKIPFIKMIAVCNSLGYSNTREGSDIDFFITTSKKRVWSARFLSVFLIKFLNLRPKKGSVKDTICMSFFVDEENLNLEKFRFSKDDIYLRFWITQLVPIYDQGGVYEKFWSENKWVEGWLPNRIRNEVVARREIFASRRSSPRNGGAEKLRRGIKGLNKNSVQVSWFEKLAKKIQLKFMNSKLKELMNKDTRVVVNDGVLKLFAVDRREEYMERWMKAVKTPVILSDLNREN